MTVTRHVHDNGADHAAARQTGSLAGLAVTLLLIVIGLYLVHTLGRVSGLQDCVLSGRMACQ